MKTKAIRYFQTDRTLTRIVSPPLFGYIYVRSGQERYFLLDKAQKVTRIVDSATKIFNAAKKDSSFIGNWSMIFIFQVELYGRKIEQE